jgi:hypothetical protein
MPGDLSALTTGMNHLRPLDWDSAVRAAAARLDEGWELPETKCDPMLQEELAAFLCAYDMLGEEVEHMDAGPEKTHPLNCPIQLPADYTKYIEK